MPHSYGFLHHSVPHFDRTLEAEAQAQYNLGLLYANGQGVPQSYAQAAQWYQSR